MSKSSSDATHVRPRDLTEANIKLAQPGDVLWDEKIKGLHLRVRGTKRSFHLYYRTKAGQERRPKLGEHGSISLTQARKMAGDMWLEIGAGKDPSQAHKDARTEGTLTDLWEEFWRRRASKKKTSSEDNRLWLKFLEPWAGSKKLSAIDYTMAADLHEDVTEESGPIQANRVLALLSAMFNFGVKPLEWIEKNPAEGVERNKETKRKRYMTMDEAMAISAALAKREATHPASVAFIYLLILTGARKGEISKATWGQVRGNKMVLSEHKTDGSGNDRVIHLPPVALAVLNTLPKVEGGTITGLASPKKLWEAVRVEAGCPDLRLHDLRHSFASAAISAGLTLPQIGELLGHSSTQTTKRYSHLQDEAAATAAGSIADKIMGQMTIGVQPTP